MTSILGVLYMLVLTLVSLPVGFFALIYAFESLGQRFGTSTFWANLPFGLTSVLFLVTAPIVLVIGWVQVVRGHLRSMFLWTGVAMAIYVSLALLAIVYLNIYPTRIR